jgi:molecular chaperone IbpA
LLKGEIKMTNQLTLRTFNIPDIHKFAVGFDSMFDELHRATAQQNQTNYPPYNVVQINENEYLISIAVAGFGQSDLTVTKEKNFLIIEGKHCKETIEQSETSLTYLHKGISERSFRREFKLADYVEVVNANLELGILNLHLQREVPEEQKAKTIAISYNK